MIQNIDKETILRVEELRFKWEISDERYVAALSGKGLSMVDYIIKHWNDGKNEV